MHSRKIDIHGSWEGGTPILEECIEVGGKVTCCHTFHEVGEW